MIYLDSSALAKLIVKEVESTALRAWLDERLSTPRYSSALARTELPRAVRTGGDTALLRAQVILGDLFQIPLTPGLLDEAGTLPGPLRPFDALHVVSAKRLGHALETLVSYDKRMLSVAEQLGLPVAAPGAS